VSLKSGSWRAIERAIVRRVKWRCEEREVKVRLIKERLEVQGVKIIYI
jgi:hypothetical protein